MEEETASFQQERSERNRQLRERQSKEIEEFDLQTTTMGLDAMHIVEATQNAYEEDDMDSIRGSMLSLTPSNSSSSFTHSNTNL